MTQGKPLNVLIAPTKKPPEVADSPTTIPDNVSGPTRDGRRPLDFAFALDAATARLNEQVFGAEPADPLAESGMRQELASALCAFGELANEADHMRTRADAAMASGLPTREGKRAATAITADEYREASK